MSFRPSCSKIIRPTDDNFEENALRWLEEVETDEEDILDENDGSGSEEVSAVEELDQSSSEQSVSDENVPKVVSSKSFIGKNGFHWNAKEPNKSVQIAAELSSTVEECKKKVTNLLSSYRRERAKVKKSVGTGKGSDEIYESNWFAYKSMEFLFDKNCPRKTLSTIPDEDSQSETQSTAADGLSDTEQEQMVSARPSIADPVSGPSSGPPSKKPLYNLPQIKSYHLNLLKPYVSDNSNSDRQDQQGEENEINCDTVDNDPNDPIL
ncbi:hypothetical protein RN001_005553 [Aquatica leii]|uniref:MADF domain-containing protein n=1 Tax=Aquatica leii TaxID=1421715 RepID=A0AAN7PCJ5_9COLE|nr:hypothetical protein RN001_005553 [Aquatica leii]